MLAIVRKADKRVLPRFDVKIGKNEPTLVVVVDVDFVMDDGSLHHSQSYAHLPDEVDQSYYQKQADAMQSDLDQAKACAEQKAVDAERNATADRQIAELMARPYDKGRRVAFGDAVKLNDSGGR